MSEQKSNKRILWFAVIVFLMAGATIGYAAVPQSTIRTTGAGITTYVGHNVNATVGYFVGGTQIVNAAREAFFSDVTVLGLTPGRVTYAGLGGILVDDADFTFVGTTLSATDVLSTSYTIGGNTLDTNEWGFLDGTDQSVSSGDAVTYATVDTGQGANDLWDMDQNVETTSDVDFNQVDSTEYFLSSVNKTDIMKYPQLSSSYIVWRDGATYYAKNGTTGVIDYINVDASTVIQSAIDSTSLRGGGRIYIESGSYLIATMINFPATGEISVVGSGSDTRLYTTDNGVTIFNLTGANVHPNDLQKSEIAYLFLDPTTTSTVQSIYVRRAHYNQIHNNRFEGGIGIFFDGAVGADADNNIISNNVFYGCTLDAIKFVGSGAAEENIIADNIFVTITGNAINMAGARNTITGNTIEESGKSAGEAGIYISDIGNTVTGNTIRECTKHGIYIDNGELNTISGNFFEFNDQADTGNFEGISITVNSPRNTVDGNVFYKNHGQGILSYGSGTIISNNIISENDLHGIHLSGLDSVLVGNTFYNNGADADDTYHGISLGGGADRSIIQNNKIYSDTVRQAHGIFVGTGATQVTISGNGIYYNAGDGIHLSNNGDQILITDNYIIDNKDYGINVNNANIDELSIIDNYLIENDDGQIRDLGTGTVIHHNKGYTTENSGTATILNTETSIYIPHGCDYTPSAKDISYIFTENPSNAITYQYVGNLTSTGFSVYINDPGVSNLDLSWHVTRIN